MAMRPSPRLVGEELTDLPRERERDREGSSASASASASASEKRPRVVVVGAGFAGALAARQLDAAARDGRIELVVVERRDHFHHKIGAIRAQVLDTPETRALTIPLTAFLPHATIVKGSVVSVDDKAKVVEVALADAPTTSTSTSTPTPKKNVAYDVLVLATGGSAHGPGDLPASLTTAAQAREYYRDTREALATGKSVVIVGGGASAVEFAGEIRAAYPTKEITVVSASEQLLSTMLQQVTPKFYGELERKLKRNHINVVLGEQVVSPGWQAFTKCKVLRGPVVVETKGPRNLRLEADAVVWAAAYRQKLSFVPDKWLNELGEVSVRPTFQTVASADVFAIGDVTNLVEPKMAQTLPGKIPILVHNVLKVAAAIKAHRPASAATSELQTYRAGAHFQITLPFGPHDGLAQLPGEGCLGGTVVRTGKSAAAIKSQDLHVNEWRDLLLGAGWDKRGGTWVEEIVDVKRPVVVGAAAAFASSSAPAGAAVRVGGGVNVDVGDMPAQHVRHVNVPSEVASDSTAAP